ncbi:MAG: hypothetical protein RBS78_01270 [Coriobacteriia bacterium]|jgi:hypothetical protein|nr:hypothetical protein [Coriobacteriia bacterium]
MEFVAHSHRHGLTLFNAEEPYATLWGEITEAIESVTDDDLASAFGDNIKESKSLSPVINSLLHERFTTRGWARESPIFAEEDYLKGHKGRFRLDFAKGVVSVEVAFNHGEAAAWNLLKPVLASELNHVRKAIQTQVGVIITVTEDMKIEGGFDSAVGTYEKYVNYLRPLNNVLTVPLALIGLKAPQSFRIVHQKEGRRRIGRVEWVDL